MAATCPVCGAAELQQGLADREQCLVCGAYYDVNGLRGPGPVDEIRENVENNIAEPQQNVVGNYADIQRAGAQVADQGSTSLEEAVEIPEPPPDPDAPGSDAPNPEIDPETGGDPQAVTE